MTNFRLLKGAMVAMAISCGVATTYAAEATAEAMAEAMAEAAAEAAASAEASDSAGILRGRVMDSEDHTMAGAAIYIKELRRGVSADVDGFYSIQGLPTGTYTLEVTYVGYTPTTMEVSVVNRETTVANIIISESTVIDNVVVTSVMKGQTRALNTQKNALNMVDVISQDQASKYPDANIGDALKRISGINVQYDQGEARFGQVRGTPADMSSVTVNGGRIPSAEGETRSVQLDLIPSDMIQTIEVNKVITPDMEADAIGGSINLVTKNSPSKQVVSATVGSGYDMVSQRAQLNLALTYGDRVNDKFGYIISASYQNNPIGSDNTEFEWDVDDDGNSYVKEMQIRQYYVQRERQSYSASFDYAFNDNHKIDFKGIYNRRNDWENRYKTKVKMKDDGTLKEVGIETKGGTEDQKYGRLEQQQTMDFTLGGEHLMGKVAIDWGATFSAASEDRPNERYIAFATEDDATQITMDYSNIRQPFAKTNTDHLTLSSVMANGGSLDELSESHQEIQEYNYGGKINFKYELGNGHYSTIIKAGAKFTSKDKSVDVYSTEYKKTLTDKDSFVSDALAATKIVDRNGFMPGSQYNFGREFVTREFLGDLNLSNSSVYGSGVDQVAERASNYEANETVTAAYLRVDQQLGDQLSMMAGVRMENTAISNSGYKYIDEDETLETTGTEKSSYTNVLPSVLFKWDATKDLKLRLSYTNSIARPKYSDLVNNIVTDGEDEIAFGNPDLEATLAHNVDLSADYYFASIGLVRAGVFYKKINDFIVDQRSSDYTYGSYTYEVSKMAINGGDATLAGAEISFSRDFSFISPKLNCVGFAGTYTYTYTDVTESVIDGRNDLSSLPGSPEHTANASLYFKKSGITARLSYNFASEFLDEVGETAFEDRYYDKASYLDLNLSYNFKKNFTVYADATNLLNQPLRYYQGVADHTMQSEFYGPRFNVGVKVNF